MRRATTVRAVRVGRPLLCLFVLLMAGPALSATSTSAQLKISPTNSVPACFAPAKLSAYVARVNPKLDPKFRDLANHYAQHGDKLGIRWDHAFFQMLVETDNLQFTGGSGRGELSKDHNNFANIRSVDSDEPDRFADVNTGVLAHLHHVRLYAGDPVAKPAAKRTKQVEGFILSWSRQLKRPVRFDDMYARWSPNNPGYARRIAETMQAFESANCTKEVAAREEPASPPERKAKIAESPPTAPATSQAARDDMPSSADSAFAEPIRTTQAAGKASTKVAAASQVPATRGAATTPVSNVPQAGIENASASAAAGAAASSGGQCKVWAASFGGEKSVLIRVNDGQVTHFTALQVNSGREKEETTAYIAAYAKGGRSVGEFTTADQAINKAFELCPRT